MPELQDRTEVAADPVLLDAHELARTALAEITDAQHIGSADGYEVHGQHVLTLFFTCKLAGYPGWRWAATVARADAESPVTVLEVELLSGKDAIVAPEWVPWSVRLAKYEAQAKQAAAAEAEDAAAHSNGDSPAEAGIDEESMDDEVLPAASDELRVDGFEQVP